MEKRLLQIIDEKKGQYIDFLKELVSRDTRIMEHGTRGVEDNGQEVVAAYLKGLGAEVDMFEPDYEAMNFCPEVQTGHDYAGRHNVVGVFKGSGGGKSLLFNGHIDTVDFEDPDAWRHPPLAACVEDGKLFGRGACDMKAGLAASIMAMDAIREAGIRLKGDVIYESVIDEEGQGSPVAQRSLSGEGVDDPRGAQSHELCG